jgi:hypothetical protein
MTGDCHVRFYESRGLQRPRPLAERHARKRYATKRRVDKKAETRHNSMRAGSKGRGR